MSDWAPPSAYLRVYDARNGIARICVEEESAIDAAVTRFADTKQDTLLHLMMVEGEEYVTLASDIVGWFKTTPELRARAREMDELLKAEEPPSWSTEEP